MTLHSIKREILPKYWNMNYSRDIVWFGSPDDLPCPHCKRATRSEHYECATIILGNQDIYFCECSNGICRTSNYVHMMVYYEDEEDDNGDFVCLHCMTGNHPDPDQAIQVMYESS